MCGIIACCSTNELSKNELQALQNGLQKISHRGPDASGLWYSTLVAFGHCRLSIIDPTSGANQPFHSNDNKLCIIFVLFAIACEIANISLRLLRKIPT